MVKHNIETVLAFVSAVEANDPDAGLALRRVVEQAEANWNAANVEANKEHVVVKTLSAEDLEVASRDSALATNENVIAFINVVKEWPEPPPPSDKEIADAQEAAAKRDAAKAEEQQRASELMAKAHATQQPQ